MYAVPFRALKPVMIFPFSPFFASALFFKQVCFGLIVGIVCVYASCMVCVSFLYPNPLNDTGRIQEGYKEDTEKIQGGYRKMNEGIQKRYKGDTEMRQLDVKNNCGG